MEFIERLAKRVFVQQLRTDTVADQVFGRFVLKKVWAQVQAAVGNPETVQACPEPVEGTITLTACPTVTYGCSKA